MKTKETKAPARVQGFTKFDLENIYLGLQMCSNHANVQPATVLYCRNLKKKALTLLQAYETELKELMNEYKVPPVMDGEEIVGFNPKGMKNEKSVIGLITEFEKKTFEIENLNQLTPIEFIKHTRGLSEEQMDVLEKYLVKAQ